MSETIIIRNDLHRSELGAANGVASLDVSGKVPDSQISVGSVTQHINDSGSTSTDIWSASKTQTQINTAVVGLLDDRGNFTPSGSYPTTGGSGTAGAILKGDIWQISGLGDGVSASVGTRSVSDGDWIRAVVDAPGQTDSNWSETSSSSSNLGNSDLSIDDNARTFTLKAGTTSTQNFSILNSDGDVGYYFNGVGNVGIGTTTFAANYGTASEDFVVGNSTSGTNTSFYLDNTGDRRYYAFQLLQKNSKKLYNVDTRGIVTYFDIANGTNPDVLFDLSAGGTKIQTSAATSATFSTHQSASSNGSVIYQMGSTINNSGGYIYINNGSGTNKIYLSGNRSGIQATWFGEGVIFGGSIGRSATAIMDVMGSGSTSATTTALFQNSSSSAALEIKDDRTSIFGNISTSYIKLDPYGVAAFGILQFCAAGTTTAYNVYDSTNAERFRVETSGMVYAKRGSLSSYMNFNTSINLWAEGTSSSFHFVGTNGSNHTVYLGNDSSHGYAEIKNSSGVTQSRISGNGDSYFLNNLAVGVASASARFHAKGSGNTSGTNTAIFQNSSSSASLTIKDDLTSTFGGVVTAPQIINTPSTVTVAANAGTVTRSYRNNNFTNSSAATMTITMSLTSALDGDMVMVRIFDFSAVAQTITWVNTENSSITVPTTSNGSTTLPLTVGFQYNGATSKWRCVGSV